METVEQRQKRLARERQRNLKRRRKVINAKLRVEVDITNMIETTLNNDNIRSVEAEVPITTNKTNTQVNRRRNWITHYELRRMDQTCAYCEAKFWMKEKDHSSNQRSSTFATCCAHGKVCLPPLLELPSYLLNLYTSSESTANLFCKNIKKYNNVLACTSFGANIDEFQGRGVFNFRIHGQVYHRIGSLLPEESHAPKFTQLYIYDTAHENQNRCNIMQDLDEGILQNLQNMLDQHNPYIQNFRQVRDIIQTDPTIEVSLLIHGDRTKDSRRYNISIASEVAAIMVGDVTVIQFYSYRLQIRDEAAIGRLYMVQPLEGERYYLRILLTCVKGATGFDHLKTVNGYLCASFKEACIRLGLLQDDTEWDACLLEAKP
ncbi:4656_t:CDS:2 [Racocetra fulgida]|uniref:4656_t:CDS:1 n=1 Tax=Racocetra fulgida TaxID=60492 RepID=A0A9N9BFB0_9GLOM|nr:4656_t:CDS:2 [Racocetra fulgida]